MDLLSKVKLMPWQTNFENTKPKRKLNFDFKDPTLSEKATLSSSKAHQVETNPTQFLTDEPKQTPSIITPDPGLQSAPPTEAKVLSTSKHLPSDKKQHQYKPLAGKKMPLVKPPAVRLICD